MTWAVRLARSRAVERPRGALLLSLSRLLPIMLLGACAPLERMPTDQPPQTAAPVSAETPSMPAGQPAATDDADAAAHADAAVHERAGVIGQEANEQAPVGQQGDGQRHTVAPFALPSTLPGPVARRAGVAAFCAQIGTVLGSVSAEGCLRHDFTDEGQRSHDGHPLLFRDHPAAPQNAGRAPRVLVIGGIHADEYSSISLVFRWLERLDAQGDPDRDWRLVPLANPDGLLSMRPARRTNARGVDINRNFDTDDWERDATEYWQRRAASDPRRAPGSGPASEPETRWLQALIGEWRPDVIVSIHAPHGLLDFDGPQSTSLRPPLRLGLLHLQPIGTYPGSLGRYGSEALAIPVLTLELPRAGIMPTAEEQEALWHDLHGWLDLHLPIAVAERGGAPGPAGELSPPRR